MIKVGQRVTLDPSCYHEYTNWARKAVDTGEVFVVMKQPHTIKSERNGMEYTVPYHKLVPVEKLKVVEL